jgi:hypothetical protein
MRAAPAHKQTGAAPGQIIHTFLRADVRIGEKYRDGRGNVWTILVIDGFRLYPVEAARWDGKSYHVRCFQADGRFDADKDSFLDLKERIE